MRKLFLEALRETLAFKGNGYTTALRLLLSKEEEKQRGLSSKKHSKAYHRPPQKETPT